MLSYKEYKLLNESLYGAINLGIKSPNAVSPPVGAFASIEETEATENEIELEEAKKSEKCKCGKMMKKGMDCDCEKDDHEDDDDDHEDDDHEDDDHEDHEDDKGLSAAQKKLPKALQKAILKKKKNKKEWSDVMSDLEGILESVDDEEAFLEVKKGLEMMKKGMEKNMKYMKKHMGTGCSSKKNMTEEEQTWWNSVNEMIGSNPNGKNWDGWTEVGEVEQAIRNGTVE